MLTTLGVPSSETYRIAPPFASPSTPGPAACEPEGESEPPAPEHAVSHARLLAAASARARDAYFDIDRFSMETPLRCGARKPLRDAAGSAAFVKFGIGRSERFLESAPATKGCDAPRDANASRQLHERAEFAIGRLEQFSDRVRIQIAPYAG